MDNSTDNTEYSRDPDGQVRLQKLLAHRGLASRRNAEEMIRGGLVRVNGTVVTVPGTKVHPEKDRVTVDGKAVPVEAEPFLFLFYKPKGVVSTLHDPDGKTTLKDFFPRINPLIHVGRLDIQSEGVLLLTNNGDLAQRILHPRYEIPRTYLVKVQGVVTPEHLDRLRSGKVRLDGRPVQPLELEQERLTETNSWYRITLTEGRNREVRRLFDALNYFVLKLTRIAFGNLDLSGLEPGEYRLVTPEEIGLLVAGTHWTKKDPTIPPARSSRKTSPSEHSSPDHARRPFRSRSSFSDRSVPAHKSESSEEGHYPRQNNRQERRYREDDRFREDGERSGARKFPGERSHHPDRERQDGPSFQRGYTPSSENRTERRRPDPDEDSNPRSFGRRTKEESSFRGDRPHFPENSRGEQRHGPSSRREENRPFGRPSTGQGQRKSFREDHPRSSGDSGHRQRSGSFRKEEERPSRYRDNTPQRRDSREDRPRFSEDSEGGRRSGPSFRREENRPFGRPSAGQGQRKSFRGDHPRSSGDSGQRQRSGSFRKEGERPSTHPSDQDRQRNVRDDHPRKQDARESTSFRKERREFDKTETRSSSSRSTAARRPGKPLSGPRGHKGPGKNHPHQP